MDVIPYARFIGSIVLGGFMIYIFFNLMDMINAQPTFQITGVGYYAFFAIWHAIPFIIIVRETIHLFMSVQKRKGLM